MNHEKLADALNEISDEYIAEAAQPKKRRGWRWQGAVAAALAVAVTATAVFWPSTQPVPQSPDNAAGFSPAESATRPPATGQALIAELLVAKPEYPEMVPHYLLADGTAWEEWAENRKQQYDQPEGYADNLHSFFAESIPVFLASESQNTVYSPANVYMALAMLAETAGGETRQEILTALNADSLDALRTQAGHLWNAHYCDDKLTSLLLANSLWLDDSLLYRTDTAQTLAQDYYASVYHGDLGTETMNQALRQWLSENTGGLLQEQVADLRMDPQTLMTLASTIYYKVQWECQFSEKNSQPGIFYGPAGEQTVTYMRRTLSPGKYYSGEDYTAVPLLLKDGSVMWLILPDEGHSPQEILKSGHALADLLAPVGAGDSTAMDIHLQLPKFDIASTTDLKSGLQALGMEKMFSPTDADFSGISWDSLYVLGAEHAARVAIDEEGIEASAYTVIMAPGAGPPTQREEIDFILDRPFLFLIESQSGVPLFAGVVNQP